MRHRHCHKRLSDDIASDLINVFAIKARLQSDTKPPVHMKVCVLQCCDGQCDDSLQREQSQIRTRLCRNRSHS